MNVDHVSRRSRSTLRHGARLRSWSGLGPLVGLLGLSAVLEVASGGTFLSTEQLGAAASFTSGVGLVALGVAMLMIAGEYDLSVSQSFAFAPIVMGSLVTDTGWPLWLSLIAGLLAALGVGAVNGIVTLIGRVPSFIATLGMLFILTSAGLAIASTEPPELFDVDSALVPLLGGSIGDTSLDAPFVWMLAIGLALAFVLEFTRFGNWTRAAGVRGGAPARAMGVPVAWVKFANFCLCAFIAGLAGCLLFADFGIANPDSGENFNLFAIVAAVIGGTSLFGGRGSMVGTMLGAAILGVLSSGLVLTGIDQQYYTGIVGCILLVAAIVNGWIEHAQRGASWRTLLRTSG